MNIVYLFFNRPEKILHSFERIRAARPARLILVADGPRPEMPTDAARCEAARKLVEQVDWPCEVIRDYAETNLGCGRRVASGITNAFQHVDRAIILEDDCVPVPSFFGFCEKILERYADDERVMAVSGDNFQNGIRRGDAAYYFSKYFHCWGWATWRRAWRHYDFKTMGWPAFRDAGMLRTYCPDTAEYQYWTGVFDRCHAGQIDTWDYQYLLACWMQSGLTILPNVNLVSNIGFDNDATHTTDSSPNSNLSATDIGELTHPAWVCRDQIADRSESETVFGIAHSSATTTHRLHPRRIFNGIRRRVNAILHSNPRQP
jgi:hypothetical protein